MDTFNTSRHEWLEIRPTSSSILNAYEKHTHNEQSLMLQILNDIANNFDTIQREMNEQSTSNVLFEPSTPTTPYNVSLVDGVVVVATSTNYQTFIFQIFVAFFGTILFLLTAGGNLMVMFSFKIERQLHTISNYFLFSLAVADVTIGFVSIPFMTIYTFYDEWKFGYIACQLWLCTDYLMSNASVLNLLLISFDRYFSVTRPLTYRPRRTTRKALVMISLTYILSMVLWPPWIISWPYFEGKFIPDGSCYVQFTDSSSIATIGTAVAAFYVPVGIMVFLYARVYMVTQTRHKDLEKFRPEEEPNKGTQRRNCRANEKPSAQSSAIDSRRPSQTAPLMSNNRKSSQSDAIERKNSKVRFTQNNNRKISNNINNNNNSKCANGVTNSVSHTSLLQRHRASVTQFVNNILRRRERSGTSLVQKSDSFYDGGYIIDNDSDITTSMEPTIGLSRQSSQCRSNRYNVLSIPEESNNNNHTTTTGHMLAPKAMGEDTPISIRSQRFATVDDIVTPPPPAAIRSHRRTSLDLIHRKQQQQQKATYGAEHKRGLQQHQQQPTRSQTAQNVTQGVVRKLDPKLQDELMTNPPPGSYTVLIQLDSVSETSSQDPLGSKACVSVIDANTSAAAHMSCTQLTSHLMEHFDGKKAKSQSNIDEYDDDDTELIHFRDELQKFQCTQVAKLHKQNSTSTKGDRHPVMNIQNAAGGHKTSVVAVAKKSTYTAPSQTHEGMRIHRSGAASDAGSKKKPTKDDNKAAKTLSAILFAFILTWTPYNILVCLNSLKVFVVPPNIWTFSYLLCYVNSTINPLCYALCNETFRRTFVRILKLQWRRQRRTPQNAGYVKRR